MNTREIAARIAIHIIYADLDGDEKGVSALAHLANVLGRDFARADPNFCTKEWERRWQPEEYKQRRTTKRRA